MLEQWKKSFHYVHLFLELLKEPNLNENMICEKIITIFGQDYGIISTFMMEATKYGTVKDIGSFGVLQTYSNDWHEFSIDKKLPVNDALNENKIVWVNTLPYWTEEYRLLSNLELDNRSKTFIAIPFSCLKYPRAVLGIFSENELESTTELVYSLRIITSISGLKIDQDLAGNNSTISKIDYLQLLTIRQKRVIALLMQDYSNSDIANYLGYSISTIKQDISKIYYELKVKNREELLQLIDKISN